MRRYEESDRYRSIVECSTMQGRTRVRKMFTCGFAIVTGWTCLSKHLEIQTNADGDSVCMRMCDSKASKLG